VAVVGAAASGEAKVVGQQARRHPLVAFIGLRVMSAVALTFAVSVFMFLALHLLPGNSASAILGRQAADKAALHHLESQFGLNQSLVTQYFTWLGHFFTGNFGTSFAAQEPVTTLISGEIGNTLVLAGATLLVLVPLAVVLGTLAGVRRGGMVDSIVSAAALGAVSVPEFVTGTLLAILFATTWKLLPAVSLVAPGASPLENPQILVLPVVTLLLSSTGYTVRMIRAGVAEVATSDYVEAARLNGVPEGRIIWRYVLPNSLVPAIQTFSLTLQTLVGGVVVVETVFQYPGIGRALIQAVDVQDTPVVLALGMLIALVWIVINLFADVACVLLVPKLRTGLT
jgi:peptide/nickel transport system permease protein